MSNADAVMSKIQEAGSEGITMKRLARELGIPRDTASCIMNRLHADNRIEAIKDNLNGWRWVERRTEPRPEREPELVANQCPECAAIGVHFVAKSPAGLSIYRTRKHGVLSMTPDAVRMREKAVKAPKKASPKAIEKKPQKRRGRPYPDDGKPRAMCPIEGCGAMIRTTKDGMNQHLVRMHSLDDRERALMAEAWAREHAPTESKGCECQRPITIEDAPPAELQDPVIEELAALGDCTDGSCTIGLGMELEYFMGEDGPRVRILGESESVPAYTSMPDPAPITADVLARYMRFPDREEYEDYLTKPPATWDELPLEPRPASYEAMPRPAPGPRDIPNTCTPIDVQHATIRTTERPQDEPTELSRLCALAVEMEALADRHGYDVDVDMGSRIEERPLIVRVRRREA